jgi:hypothetical protein
MFEQGLHLQKVMMEFIVKLCDNIRAITGQEIPRIYGIRTKI